MSSASQVRRALIKESVFGELPSSPTMKEVPFKTGDLFKNDRGTVESAEVQSVRKPRRKRSGVNKPGGSLAFELQWQTFDELIAGAMGDEWSGGFENTSSVTVSAGGVFTNEDGKNWEDLGYKVGNFILYDDDGTPTVLYVSVLSTTTMTTLEADGSTTPTLTAVGSAAGKTLIVGAVGGRIDATVNNVTFAAAAQTVTLSGGLVWSDLGYDEGDNIRFSGTSSNDGWKKIAGIAGNVMTTVGALVDETVDSGAVDHMTDAGTVSNGNTLPSFSFEEALLDHNAGAGAFRGMYGSMMNQLSVNLQKEAAVECTLDVIGAKMDPWGSTKINDSIQAHTSTQFFSTFDGSMKIDGADGRITSLSLTLNNQLERQLALFERNAGAIDIGIPEITGELSAYFDDASVHAAKFDDETEFAMWLRLVGPDEDAYIISMSTVYYLGDTISIGDINTTESLNYTVQPNTDGAELTMRRQAAAR